MCKCEVFLLGQTASIYFSLLSEDACVAWVARKYEKLCMGYHYLLHMEITCQVFNRSQFTWTLKYGLSERQELSFLSVLTSKLALTCNDISEATSLLVFLWARITIYVVIIPYKAKKSLTLGFNFLNEANRKQFYPTGIVSMPFSLSRASWLCELGGRFSAKGG